MQDDPFSVTAGPPRGSAPIQDVEGPTPGGGPASPNGRGKYLLTARLLIFSLSNRVFSLCSL